MERKLYRKYCIIILLLLFFLKNSCSLFKALDTPLDINHEYLIDNNMTFGCGEGVHKYYCERENCTLREKKECVDEVCTWKFTHLICEGVEIELSEYRAIAFIYNKRICADENPCGNMIYDSDRKLCHDKFISIQTPCNGTCIDETYDTFCSGQDWREYGAKDLCIKRNQSCYGKCLHQDIPNIDAC